MVINFLVQVWSSVCECRTQTESWFQVAAQTYTGRKLVPDGSRDIHRQKVGSRWQSRQTQKVGSRWQSRHTQKVGSRWQSRHTESWFQMAVQTHRDWKLVLGGRSRTVKSALATHICSQMIGQKNRSSEKEYNCRQQDWKRRNEKDNWLKNFATQKRNLIHSAVNKMPTQKLKERGDMLELERYAVYLWTLGNFFS